MKNSLIWLLVLAAGSSLWACGSSSSDSSSGSNANCSAAQHRGSDSPECRTCVEQRCASEYSAFCSADCSQNSTSSACQKASDDIGSCVFSHCLSECDKTSAGGTSGGTAPGTGGTFTGGTFTVGGADSSSAGEPSSGEPSSGSSTETSSCYVPESHNCTMFTVPTSERDVIDKQCTDQGGSAADACPTKNLAGCCVFAGGVETCGYDGDMSPVSQDACEQSGGTWRTKP